MTTAPAAAETPGDSDDEDEFHGDAIADDPEAAPADEPTWTLAALSALKPRGREVAKGHVKRMLRAALPLGGTIELVVDGDVLRSSKADAEIDASWVLGRDFAPTDVHAEGVEPPRRVRVTAHGGDRPYLEVEGVGKVTGEIRLYEKSIAGGKSTERGASNGFAVNVRGRTINLHAPHFGLPALSHAVWAKVRITVRADGLNDDLSVSRESVEDSAPVQNFRGLLRACFNHARSHYAQGRQFPDVHELLRDEWGTVPISPLLHAVELAVDSQLTLDLVDLRDLDDDGATAASLREAMRTRPQDTLHDIVARPLGGHARLSTYHLADRSVVINSDHPYWIEQLTSDIDKKEMLGLAATVSLLSDAYLLEMGVDPSYVDELRSYRDQVERVVAAARRRSAPVLVDLLERAGNDRTSLEKIVAECLERLGFHVHHQAQSGKPEGIATADLAPDVDGKPRRYRLIYEAKSTKAADRKVSTKDVNVSGQDRHRRHAAADTDDPTEVDYALVVAPGFREGALEDECDRLSVCPMLSADLGRLLMGAAVTGSADLAALADVFTLTDPDAVAAKITELIERQRAQLRLTIGELVEALNDFDNVTRLNVGTISTDIRRRRTRPDGARHVRPNEEDVANLMRGLQMLAPSAVQVVGDQVILGTTPERLAEAIRAQTALLPEDARFELDRLTLPDMPSSGAHATAG